MQPLSVISVVIAVLCTRCVEGQSDMRSSLSFVIDSTGSMHDDIAAVKIQIKSIFDTVKNSNTSQIEDFILVEFNDPSDTIVRTITSDETKFKKELESIRVYGGGDCPERALDGIAKALEVSKPGSYIYVFTDADANDRSKVEAVKSVAIEKGIRIVFLLTGSCSSDYDPTYYQLAEATKGIIFPLKKDEVHEVLNYVKETVKSRKDVILEKKLPAGDHKLDYLVDSNMKELIVTVTGKNPKVHLYDPYGDEAMVEEVTRTSMVAIVKVVEVKPGVYTANIHSDEKSSVAVSGTSTMHFVHGFSRLEPTAIEETTMQPYPDGKSYLSVKVNVEGGAIELNGIEIIDLDYNVIIEKSLDLVNHKDQFYSTGEAFLLPDEPFRIAIKGFDVETKSIITRYGLTTIEPQKRKTVSIANKAPEVAVIGRSNYLLESEDLLQLKCRISAYPKPTITWTDDAGNKIKSDETQIEIPYDYVSVVDLDSKDISNTTLTCKASNDLGVDIKNIEVKIKRTKFFDIVETPNDAAIEYDHEAIFRCKVDAGPEPAKIKWFMKGKPIHESRNYVVSEDGTALIIKSMKPYLDGMFSCIAKNNLFKKVFRFHITTTGIEKPIIDKNVTDIRAIQGQSATITCRTLQGLPKPNIRWFFKSKYTDGIKQLSGEETIFIKKVTIANAGTYRCEAYNDAGTDYRYEDLIVEYPPTIIRRDKRQISTIEGNPVKLPCEVLGEPRPEVKWYLNGAEVSKAKHIHLLKTNSVRFKASIDLSGNFTCKARNYLGAAESEPVVVSVTIPVNIQTPDKSSYEVPVGSDLSLNCISDGYPQPEITWSFNNLKFSAPAKSLKPQSDGSLQLPRLQVSQEGYYTCTAKNIGSTANITYTLNIVAPPKIINSRPDKTYAAVLGDLTLRVPCSTLGTPTPTIIWKKDGFNVATGNEWYDLEADGTLVIKNIDNKSKGAYECLARNHLGYDTDIYNIDIIDTPKTGVPTKKLELAEDGTSHIPCNVPHASVDLLRWFKDGKEIASGELTLRNVTRADTGLYTCRVSNFLKSDTGNTEVVVGYKPKFLTNPDTKIEYLDGNMAVLDCSGAAQPIPTVVWSYKNKRSIKVLKETEMIYRLKMKPESVGTYFCLVKNQYGYVVRQFEIESKDCALNIVNDFGADKPVIQSIEPARTKFDVIDGYMQIPQNHTVKLTCSDAFVNFAENEVLATCIEGTRFDFDGVEYKYKDIKCNDVFEPVVIDTNNNCIELENHLLKVGYEVNDKFNEVYEICWDKYRNLPIYSKQNMDKSLANIDLKKNQKLFNSDFANFDMDLMYDCYAQIDWISSILGKQFIPKENVCFAQRQLVNSRDVSPGLSQVSTYMDVNVIPLWGSYSERNWELVEKKIRTLAMSTDHELTVWTGISNNLNLEGHKHDITITDNGEEIVHVPKYVWKVVEDPVKRSSLAIVQVNVPDLRPANAHKYVRCRDICSEVKWMHSKTWRNANRGFVFCCSIKDFIGSFGFQELFRGVSEDVLR